MSLSLSAARSRVQQRTDTDDMIPSARASAKEPWSPHPSAMKSPIANAREGSIVLPVLGVHIARIRMQDALLLVRSGASSLLGRAS